MCVANSARSQLAEGLAKNILGKDFEIQSAGSKPSQVNPLAIQALKEVGIDITSHHSKSIDDLDHGFVKGLDYVITLCAEEVCPILMSKAKKLHWPLQDPSQDLDKFRMTRDLIREKLIQFKRELKP